MKRENKNTSASKKQINAAKQVENTNAQVVDNKSTLAGEQENLCKDFLKNLRKLWKTRSTINGRLIDLADANPDYASILKSGDFKGAVKLSCDNLVLAQTDGKGNTIGTYVLPMRFVPLASKETYADYTIEDCVVKLMGRKSAKNWSLVGFTHDGVYTPTANFADLRHDYTHEVTRTQSAIAADGTQVTVAVYEQDENGNRKAIKDAVTETFVPVYCDTISPKAFEKAVAKAMQIMWLKLFAASK